MNTNVQMFIFLISLFIIATIFAVAIALSWWLWGIWVGLPLLIITIVGEIAFLSFMGDRFINKRGRFW